MRPACLRNARSLASAHPPVLPFLAPRAFADTSSIAQDDRKPPKKTEKKREIICGRVLANNASLSHSIGARYADIFSFARQQMRSYSTESSGGRDRRDGARISIRRAGLRDRRLRTRSQVPKGGVSGTVEGLKQPNNKTRTKSESQLVSRPGKHTHVYHKRRQKRLELHRRTIGYFVRWELPKHPGIGRSAHGKYRSLRRRIFALSATKPHMISLDEPFDPTKALRQDLDPIKAPGGNLVAAAFAALDKTVYPGLKRISCPIVLKHHDMCSSWTASLFSGAHTSEADQVWRNWSAFDVEIREQYWPHMLIYLLDKFPERALTFLQVLTHHPCVETLDARILADALEHLARLYMNQNIWRSAQKERLQAARSDFIPTFYHIFQEHLAPHKHICSQDLLFCLTELASVEEFQRLFDLLKQSDAWIGYDLLLHYANTFAKTGEFRQALVCLRVIVEGAESEDSRVKLANMERFRWSCALILARSTSNKENYHETTGIVAAFVELGVKLDILLYNVIMHKAMEAGDYATAFKVYNTLNDNGLQPDKYTFSILLHGSTMTSEPSKFNDFAEYAAETAKELKDPWLAADYIYFLFVRLHLESTNPQKLVDGADEVLRAYLRFFSPHALEPFQQLVYPSSRARPLSTEDVLSESAFMDPPPVALYIILQLNILKAASTSHQNVWDLYLKFADLVRTQHDSVLTKLAQNPIIWNAFLLSFCRANNFEHASQLVHDMSAHGTDPNIYTWNIFMQGFFKAQQIKAAERVFEIMRSRGIEPDQFSYEVMLRGYARAQHVKKLGAVMQHMEDEQLNSNGKLLRDLARVHDQKRVAYELEKARAKKERWAAAVAKAKEERERRKWAPPAFRPLVEKEEEMDLAEGPRIKHLLERGRTQGFKSALKR